MGSAILVAIVGAWACFLIPLFLRRHDSVTELESVDRFATAMRVLARRRRGAPGERYVVMPRRRSDTTRPVRSGVGPAYPQAGRTGRSGGPNRSEGRSVPSRQGAPRPAAAGRRVPTSRVRPAPQAPAARAAQARALARRRRVFLTLLAVVVGGLVAGVLVGGVVWVVPLVAVATLTAYVGHLRREAERAAALARRRRRALTRDAARYAVTRGVGPGGGHPEPAGFPARGEPAYASAEPAPRVRPAAPMPPAPTDYVRTYVEPRPRPAASVDAPGPSKAAALPEPAASSNAPTAIEAPAALIPPAAVEAPARIPLLDEDTWEPQPVPVPTYVTAPKAPPRVLDLTRPGVWTKNQLPARSDEEFFEPPADPAWPAGVSDQQRASGA